MSSIKRCLVALVAFGATSCQKISRVLTRLNIDYRIVLPNEIPEWQPTHIILSGGPKHVYEDDHDPMPQWVLDSECPVLGICYGMQLIAKTFGGIVVAMPEKELGRVYVTEIIDGIQETRPRWMHRRDRVLSTPTRFHITGVTSNDHIAAFTDYNKFWAVQYHPESPKCGDLTVFKRFFKHHCVMNHLSSPMT
jgi:GMP synthase (glutamine-hydrolysing)